MTPSERSRVGILGAGRLGQAMARTALRAGRFVVLANSRGPASLGSLVSELGDGVVAGTVEEAAAEEVVVIAVPWDRVPEAVRGLDWNGRVVIDATNDFDGGDLGGRTSSERVAELVPGASVVKAANTLRADILGSYSKGMRRKVVITAALLHNPPVVFFDEPLDGLDANAAVGALFREAGFFTVDLGGLAAGGVLQQIHHPLAGLDLVELSDQT